MHSRINQTRLPGLQNKVGTRRKPENRSRFSGSAPWDLFTASRRCSAGGCVRFPAGVCRISSLPRSSSAPGGSLPPIRARTPGFGPGSEAESQRHGGVNADGGVTAYFTGHLKPSQPDFSPKLTKCSPHLCQNLDNVSHNFTKFKSNFSAKTQQNFSQIFTKSLAKPYQIETKWLPHLCQNFSHNFTKCKSTKFQPNLHQTLVTCLPHIRQISAESLAKTNWISVQYFTKFQSTLHQNLNALLTKSLLNENLAENWGKS